MCLNETLWENGYLSGEKDRIFINTSLGCSASCEYCYLPDLGSFVNAKVDHHC